MNDLFRNTLSPLQWGLLAVVPLAILALYFLKLKRMPLEVPSTYLWRKAIEDLHVNSLWQRLRKSLLLFLQLLIVALAIFALLRPGWEGTKLEGQKFVFLIDNSASMSARDVEGNSRLDAAKRQVEALIDQMDSGMTAMIVSFADGPRVVQEFTDDTRLLRERLATIEPTHRATDAKEALKLASEMANAGTTSARDDAEGSSEINASEPVTAYIYSDGRFADAKDVRLKRLSPVYVPVGTKDAQNVAVTAFSTRRNESRPEERQAFVQVTNFSDEPAHVVAEVQLSGEFLDAKNLDVPAGDSLGVTFPLADAPPGSLEVRLSGGGLEHDVLVSDNRAYVALNDAPPGTVLVVSPGNVALETALGTERAKRLATIEFAKPEVLKQKDHQQRAESGAYSLIVYDQCTPEKMPRANTLFAGAMPPIAAWAPANADAAEARAAKLSLPQIIDWNRAHPLLANVELGNIDILASERLTVPQGGTSLIDSTGGTIFAIAPRDGFEDAVLGFPIVSVGDGGQAINTNWPRRHSFPTFWLNVLEYFVGQADDQASPNSLPGQPVELRTLTPTNTATVVTPDGERHTLKREALEPFQFHQTEKPGVYEVIEHDQVTGRFAVNLFDREESDVRLRPSADSESPERTKDLRIGETSVPAEGLTPARRELWRPLLLAALLVLLVEWYIYNRRVYV
jgi:hypothetical protein